MLRTVLLLVAGGCLCVSLLCAAYATWQVVAMVGELKKRMDKLEEREAVGGVAFYG